MMTSRTVIIAGAAGLVGVEILEGVLANQAVAAVHSLGRRVPARQHPKLTSHTVDFTALTALPPADEVYLALGTTRKIAGHRKAERHCKLSNWLVPKGHSLGPYPKAPR